MNIKRLIPCFLLISPLLLGSCENEQITDMERQGTELPEGKYPLTFTAVQAIPEETPQTRVSESENGMSSHWDGGEVINVQIADGKAGTYRLDEGGNATAQTPCYWQNTNKANINAWYSNISGQATETNTDKIVNLSDQSKGLAYVLKATANDVSYNSQDIELKFHHQLAKVRVKLEGEKAEDVTSVQVNNYTSCTVTNGNVSGNDTGYIQMRKNGDYYEANIVPMESIAADNFIRLNGKAKATISDISELNAGKVYTITLTVNQGPLQPGDDGKFTITGGDVTIKDYRGNAPIVVSGPATITIENVQLTTEGTAMAIITPYAHVTLNVVGTDNSFISKNGSGIIADGYTNINIVGNGADNSKLTVVSGDNPDNKFNVGIGVQISGYGDWTRGNITINNVALDVTTGKADYEYNGSAIGMTGRKWDDYGTVICGDIKIKSSHIVCKTHENSTAACIGTSHWQANGNLSMGGIYIDDSTITATSHKGGACIGLGYIARNSVTMQRIEINNSTLNLTSSGEGYKVGTGKNFGTATITEGIFVDGVDKGKDGWNP